MSKSGELSSPGRFGLWDVQCCNIKCLPLSKMILSLLLLVLMTSVCVAQPEAAVPRFWGLKQGDKFVFTVAGSRRTNIVVDGQPLVTQETSESLQIQFTAVDFERNGDVGFRVVVLQIDRKPETAGGTKINVPQMFLRVQPDGKVSTLDPEIREVLVATLADGNPETINVMKKCLTDESIASWFSVPFWARGPAEDSETQTAWERTHEVSLGTLGTLQMDLGFTPGEIEKDSSKVAITGDARFRPLVLPEADTAAFPFFSDVSVEIDEISGTAMSSEPSTGKNPASSHALRFESVDWTLKLHGEAKLINAGTSNASDVPQSDADDAGGAKAGAAGGKVTFQQTQHHVWKLQSFESASRRMFENDRLREMVVPVE